MSVYYLQTGSTDPAYNLAFEEYVLNHYRNGNIVILWQNHNAVIVGRNQNAEAEINRPFVEQHGIRVVRRNTGGGAVYHDMGNLNYSFITDAGDLQDRSATRFTGPVVQALRGLGLDAESSGRNDILISGRKVSGTAQQLLKGRILHHGTLLFDSDPEMIAGALNPDPTKFQSKSVQSVRSRVSNIRSALESDMDMAAFWAYLRESFTRSGMIPLSLSPAELSRVEALKTEKYDTWEWNFGRSPKYEICFKRRHGGGLLELHLSVSAGNITALKVMGDFLALTELAPLEEALAGCPYREDAIRSALAPLPFSQLLGSITQDEFITTLLNK
ncbi:MAG: lipoate--protein ligase [Ruminococcaceae bacterium]|nr:lipoate--protein ligase [Oscillospiraceae bacterium]